jgi:hypothetical protein
MVACYGAIRGSIRDEFRVDLMPLWMIANRAALGHMQERG